VKDPAYGKNKQPAPKSRRYLLGKVLMAKTLLRDPIR